MTVEVPSGFYSSVPSERVAALKRTTEGTRDELLSQLPEWPLYSPGGLNAWLVFLGPSPGASPSETGWSFDPRPSIQGAHPGVSKYRDTRGFWNGIRAFAKAILWDLEPEDAYAATMVRNLDPRQSATAPQGIGMRQAAQEVHSILDAVVKPRLVIALGGARQYTDPAFRNAHSVSGIEAGELQTSLKGDPRPWCAIAGRWSTGQIYRYVSPSGIHPSLSHVSKEDAVRFLTEQSAAARDQSDSPSILRKPPRESTERGNPPAHQDEIRSFVYECQCKRCRALVSLVEEAGAVLQFTPSKAGRLCELAVVATAGEAGIDESLVVPARRDYAKHLGVTLTGNTSNNDKPVHIKWAIKNSNHNPNAKNRINLGKARASFSGGRYRLMFRR